MGRLSGAIRWLPWRWLLRRAARSQGFLDPLAVMARLRRFGQPAEVAEPIELLRAGMIFHARGLVNTRVIQHNLDWVWPWWIEQQFDPASPAFLPRAFSITHVNLTHRNWTAVGRPDCAALPIVDPRGLVTPLDDGWSLDAWVLGEDGSALYPARAASADQQLRHGDDDLSVVTRLAEAGLGLTSEAWLAREADRPVLYCRYQADADQPARLAISLRPYNPEGISFVHGLEQTPVDGGLQWQVDRGEGPPATLELDERPQATLSSDYHGGDVALALDQMPHGQSAAPDAPQQQDCETGLVTAAALYAIEPGVARTVTLRIPLSREAAQSTPQGWAAVDAAAAQLQLPDARYQALYRSAVRTLAMHSVEDIYPGPYTYRRFWFRDAAFIINSLLQAGLVARAEKALAAFPTRQTRATGYFHSQEGEWDSNGQALWILERFHALTGRWPSISAGRDWHTVVRRGAEWIARKRLDADSDRPEAGLLPAGFSAEHLGPNDYYYWDDEWAVAGLRAAARLMDAEADAPAARWMRAEAEDLAQCIDRAQANDARRLGAALLPASPLRRMDAGAIGSVVGGYPLQQRPANDAALLATVDYLLAAHRVGGGFFQEMIHAGINAYLTLHLAQILMRAGDDRGLALIEAVADLASPTGQWPEAIHPHTRGGCMGDGQHVWAAAEWVSVMRNAFCREEDRGLVLGAGVLPRWLAAGETLSFGPTPTVYGAVSVTITPESGGCQVEWRIDGGDPAWITVALPGHAPVALAGEARATRVEAVA